MDDSNDFEDPFSYVPLKRKKIKSKSSTNPRNSKPTQKKTPNPKKSAKKTPVLQKNNFTSQSRLTQTSPIKPVTNPQTPTKQLSMDLFTNRRTKPAGSNAKGGVGLGVCPVCQLPLDLLAPEMGSEVHISSCIEISRAGAEPCPQGILCSCRSIYHYVQYSHNELAQHRDMHFLELPTVILDGSNAKPKEAEWNLALQRTRDTSNLDISRTPRRRTAKAQEKSRTDLEQIAPPVSNSTPARHRRVISPIERRKSQELSIVPESDPGVDDGLDNSEDILRGGEPQDHVTMDESGPSLLGSQTVNRFLRGLEKSPTDESLSLLTRCKKQMKERKDAMVSSDKSSLNLSFHDASSFDPDLNEIINGAIENVDQAVTEEEANNPQTRRPVENLQSSNTRNPSNNSHMSTTTPHRPQPPQVRNKSRSSNLRYSETEALCTESPFQIRAVKDSEELELSLDLNTKVNCKHLKLLIPLRGDRVPVEVTAMYSDRTSPAKQAKITSYFNMNKNKPDFDNSQSDINYTADGPQGKKPRLENVVAEWAKIMTKKLVQDTGIHQTVAKSLFGSKWEQDRGEETKRKVPFYKKIPGTRFSVDGFNYGSIPGVKYSFLSHYHYDHYQGLTRHWSGQIVCSSLTKRMVVKFLRVQDSLVLTLDPGESRIFDGVEVTSVDANHCPGSLMFVFRLTTGSTILHTGDFRASPDMESDPVFWNHRNIDTVYLDTTYCKPEYDFPPQHLVIEHSILQIEDMMSKYNTVAVLVGAYTIGKERIFKGIAEHLDCKVWANPSRLKTWEALQDPEINRRIVKDRLKAVVHVIPQKSLDWKGLEIQLQELKLHFDHVLGVKPTGWTHSTGLDPECSLAKIKAKTRGRISLLEVPYSEHSSYSELKRFIQFLRIKSTRQIIPTVNLRDRGRMNGFFEDWIKEALMRPSSLIGSS